MVRDKHNTSGIIQYPFWQMIAEDPKATYACIDHKTTIALLLMLMLSLICGHNENIRSDRVMIGSYMLTRSTRSDIICPADKSKGDGVMLFQESESVELKKDPEH